MVPLPVRAGGCSFVLTAEHHTDLGLLLNETGVTAPKPLVRMLLNWSAASESGWWL